MPLNTKTAPVGESPVESAKPPAPQPRAMEALSIYNASHKLDLTAYKALTKAKPRRATSAHTRSRIFSWHD
jgi:hypothetical protein